MSPREQAQHEIVEFLENNGRFNAPYGILEGMEKFAKGKVRTITFGIARYLDAEVKIYSPKSISVNGRGPAAHRYCGHFKSTNELIQHFSRKN